MLKCKKCSSVNFCKAGFTRNQQRYKCKDCSCFFTDTPLRGYSSQIKKQALMLYLEGLGFRAIGRFLGVSNVAVLKWIRSLAGKVQELIPIQNTKKVIITTMELDEMWHYVGKKNKSYGSGWLLTEIQGKSLPGNLVLVVRRQEESCGKK